MLYYQTIDNNPSAEWIVYVHGAGGSANVWFRQIKFFAEDYNLLLIDLRGHGQSIISAQEDQRKLEEYTFEELANDIIEVLDHLNLKDCHFIGLSLGTIIIREIAETHPEYVRSMILAGAVIKLNIRTKLLSRLADWMKSIVPYMMLYKIYAHILMPNAAHRDSRNLFINNAMKMAYNEFMNWMGLNSNLNDRLSKYNVSEPPMPTLFIMGENDYVFLAQVKTWLHKHHKYSRLYIVPKAGHICNIDNCELFNITTKAFLEDYCSTANPTKERLF